MEGGALLPWDAGVAVGRHQAASSCFQSLSASSSSPVTTQTQDLSQTGPQRFKPSKNDGNIIELTWFYWQLLRQLLLRTVLQGERWRAVKKGLARFKDYIHSYKWIFKKLFKYEKVFRVNFTKISPVSEFNWSSGPLPAWGLLMPQAGFGWQTAKCSC